jgi:DNA-binding beta-propeller fold protein YncE
MVRRREQRGLTTILFTDICRSTEIATELGDRRWRHLQMRHHAAVRKQLKRHGGRELDTAGDGFFASFASPAAGVRCAFAIVTGLREIGLDIRAGLHIGEAELSGEKVGGIAVTTAKRVEESAGPAQVLTTDTIVHLVTGSGFDFTDIGSRELKGVPGLWELFNLDAVDGESLGLPLDPPAAIELRDRATPAPGAAQGRSRLVVAAAVVAGVAVVAALWLALGRTHEVTVAPNSLARIDPAQDRVTGSVPVGQQPNLIAADASAIWAVSFEDGTLYRVDAASGPEQTPKGLGGHPTGLAIGDSALWLTDEFNGTLTRVDPTTRQPTPVLDDAPGLKNVVFADGELWVTNIAAGTVLEIDPATGHTKQPIDVGRRPDGIAAGDGDVWVDSSLDRTITKIDEATGKPSSFTVDHAPGALAFGLNALWVANPQDDSVTQIDPKTNGLIHVFDVGDGPAAIAVGADRVWVADSLDGTVAAIDPVDGSITRIHVGGRPSAITVDQTGGVWVGVSAP